MTRTVKQFFGGSVIAVVAVFGAVTVSGQSTNQEFPTPVTENVIEAKIAARDIGDSRLTNYFYTFDGDQGDLFINIVTNNLTGDIDLFTLDGLRPMTKISVYGDLSESETGRVVYLRKREKLLLRVQGRTPNDEPATLRIKFAGSFIAATAGSDEAKPELPTVTADNKSGIVVNSVGTVIERRTEKPAKEKPAETETQAEAIAKGVPIAENEQIAESKAEPVEESPAEPKKVQTETPKVEVVVTENIEPEKPAKVEAAVKEPRKTRRKRKVAKKPVNEDVETRSEVAEKSEAAENPTGEEKAPARSLASIRLIVLFKDGSKIERPMDEVLRFTVDGGVLTIISKDGRIGRYSIFDIEKTTIE